MADPEEAIERRELRALVGSFEHGQLLTQEKVLHGEFGLGFECRSDGLDHCFGYF